MSKISDPTFSHSFKLTDEQRVFLEKVKTRQPFSRHERHITALLNEGKYTPALAEYLNKWCGEYETLGKILLNRRKKKRRKL